MLPSDWFAESVAHPAGGAQLAGVGVPAGMAPATTFHSPSDAGARFTEAQMPPLTVSCGIVAPLAPTT